MNDLRVITRLETLATQAKCFHKVRKTLVNLNQSTLFYKIERNVFDILYDLYFWEAWIRWFVIRESQNCQFVNSWWEIKLFRIYKKLIFSVFIKIILRLEKNEQSWPGITDHWRKRHLVSYGSSICDRLATLDFWSDIRKWCKIEPRQKKQKKWRGREEGFFPLSPYSQCFFVCLLFCALSQLYGCL